MRDIGFEARAGAANLTAELIDAGLAQDQGDGASGRFFGVTTSGGPRVDGGDDPFRVVVHAADDFSDKEIAIVQGVLDAHDPEAPLPASPPDDSMLLRSAISVIKQLADGWNVELPDELAVVAVQVEAEKLKEGR